MRQCCLALIPLFAAWVFVMPGEPPRLSGPTTHKTVVITGGTSGLGHAAVLLFAERGDTVYTCGRNKAKIRSLNNISGVHATVVDMAKGDDVQAWASEVGNRTKVDVLINNAGQLRVGDPAAAITMQAFSQIIDVNLKGVVAATTSFWPILKRPTSLVINIGSTTETEKLSQAFHSIYTISKVALRAYSTALRQEGRLTGVRVVHVKAGSFESGLHSAFNAAGATLAKYPTEFSQFATKLQVGIEKKLRMVRERSSAHFAESVFSIAHQNDPQAEYYFNVSWLEILVDLLPQRLLDFIVMQDYK